jgi:DNA-binding MarR family transcriptional regulator
MPHTASAAPVSATAALAGELRVVVGKLVRRLREQSQMDELTLAQIAALLRLERDGPATVSALARADGMRPQSMGANIAALEAAGLVSGAPDPDDGRQTLWKVTALYRDRVAAARAKKEDWLMHALEDQLSPTEQAQLAGALDLLRRLAHA